MTLRPGPWALAAALGVLVTAPHAARAQLTFGASAVGLATRSAVPGDSSLTELRVIAPVLFGSFAGLGGRFMAHAMLNLEGWTVPGGVLTPGDWGEGWYDRRHPHTFFHELMVSATDLPVLPGGWHWSLAAGKGFAPFGSDDPMNRPVLMYPVNHHWAQILERAVAILGVRRGPVVFEAGAFDGDEPERWAEWPKWSRFADSWAVRGLVHPAAGVELQASYARVKSPESRAGGGPVNDKVSVSARVDRPLAGGTLYGLAEWESTSESNGFFVFHAVLAEGQWRRGRWRPYARLEIADRPEEPRVFGDPFRAPRPPTDNSLNGITRWTTVTGGLGVGLPRVARWLRTEAIAEAAWAHVRSLEGVFDPASFYGRTGLWVVNLGLRVTAGDSMHRMGRYGVAAGEMPTMPGAGRMPEMGSP